MNVKSKAYTYLLIVLLMASSKRHSLLTMFMNWDVEEKIVTK